MFQDQYLYIRYEGDESEYSFEGEYAHLVFQALEEAVNQGRNWTRLIEFEGTFQRYNLAKITDYELSNE